MSEQYLVAAKRHYDVGEMLMANGANDDAGYHFGLSGETAIKAMLQLSGIETGWLGSGKSPRKTPMRSHLPQIKTLITMAQAEIQQYAQGRLAGEVTRVMLDPAFSARFDKWMISIRYADTQCTPVKDADCARWRRDALDMLESALR